MNDILTIALGILGSGCIGFMIGVIYADSRWMKINKYEMESYKRTIQRLEDTLNAYKTLDDE
jgi:hypothetical protein